MLPTNSSSSRRDDAPPTPPARRRVLRSILAGAIASLLILAWIKGAEPALFEGREDRVIEQCLKTGLAVFAFTLLFALARDHKTDT